MRPDWEIAVIGAGLGGLVAAALLEQRGYRVRVYEQAPAFERLGAGINLSPNVMKVLRAAGVEAQLLEIGLRPEYWISRKFDTGETMFRYDMRDACEAAFGACYMVIHRGDFHEILTGNVAPGTIAFGKKLVALERNAGSVALEFEDGSWEEADIVIGADGIGSTVREALLGPELPVYSGYVGHRCIIPADRLGDLAPADVSKWWSDDAHRDTHMVVYYLDRNRDEIYFVTGVPQPEWDYGFSHVDADYDELRAAFADFHPEIHTLIDISSGATKWPLFDREPLPLWSDGRLVLIGDACHPMKPHMGQGAAMAIEDAAILVRCLEQCGEDHAGAFALYEESRKGRCEAVQQGSRDNKWLRNPMDPAWVFSYDAMTVPLGG